MESPTKPYVQIIFHTKEGHEYSRRIEFDETDNYEKWNFGEYMGNIIMHCRGMFETDQSTYISIDTIARIEYESYDGVPF